MDRYYYAGGRRIELEAAEDLVAVDRTLARSAGLDIDFDPSADAAVRQGVDVVVAPRASLDAQRLASLRGAGALRPVFRRDRALVVAMPEIRVEFDDSAQRRAVMDILPKAPHPVSIAEDTKDRLVLRATSGSGDEALSVANYLHEGAHPAAASVRFVQFVPKPGPGQR